MRRMMRGGGVGKFKRMVVDGLRWVSSVSTLETIVQKNV